MHGFPVRTPICHIVPTSRMYRGEGRRKLKSIYHEERLAYVCNNETIRNVSLSVHPDLLQSPEMAQFWTPRIYPYKYPTNNTEKNKKSKIFRFFFRGIFGEFSWGSRISARGVFFRYFSWEFRAGPSRGSVAGRGVLKCKYKCRRNLPVDRKFFFFSSENKY